MSISARIVSPYACLFAISVGSSVARQPAERELLERPNPPSTADLDEISARGYIRSWSRSARRTSSSPTGSPAANISQYYLAFKLGQESRRQQQSIRSDAR